MAAEYSTVTVDGAEHRIVKGWSKVNAVDWDTTKGNAVIDGAEHVIRIRRATPLPENSEGKTVILKRGGVKEEYIVVHQGKPDSDLYDASCDGIWLLKTLVSKYITWASDYNNSYNSDALQAILTDFYNGFDAVAKNAIKTVKIPYSDGYLFGGRVNSGASGLQTHAFLLSASEVCSGGVIHSTGEVPIDGATLSYFAGIASNVNNSKRVAYFEASNKQAAPWATRTPNTGSNRNYCAVNDLGYVDANYGASLASVGFRPSVILNSSSLFDPTTYELVE